MIETHFNLHSLSSGKQDKIDGNLAEASDRNHYQLVEKQEDQESQSGRFGR